MDEIEIITEKLQEFARAIEEKKTSLSSKLEIILEQIEILSSKLKNQAEELFSISNQVLEQKAVEVDEALENVSIETKDKLWSLFIPDEIEITEKVYAFENFGKEIDKQIKEPLPEGIVEYDEIYSVVHHKSLEKKYWLSAEMSKFFNLPRVSSSTLITDLMKRYPELTEVFNKNMIMIPETPLYLVERN